MSDGRSTDGKFASGNSGGPGRPRRAVEREDLGVVASVVTLERWQKIVESAAAEGGDDKARGWLSGFVLGNDRPTLWDMARRDMLGVSVDAELEAQALRDRRTPTEQLLLMEERSTLDTALAMAKAKQNAEATEAARVKRQASRKSATA